MPTLLGSALTFQEKKKMQAQIKKLQKSDHVQVNKGMHDALFTDMETNVDENQEFIQLFWAEQKKMFKRKNEKGKCYHTGQQKYLIEFFLLGHRWHPMLLRFALHLHSQSPAAYRSLKQTGLLRLPGETTLQSYTNYIHPESGYNPLVIEEIRKAAEKCSGE